MNIQIQDGDEYFMWKKNKRTGSLLYRIRNNKLHYPTIRDGKHYWQPSVYTKEDIKNDPYFLGNIFEKIPISEIVLMDVK